MFLVLLIGPHRNLSDSVLFPWRWWLVSQRSSCNYQCPKMSLLNASSEWNKKKKFFLIRATFRGGSAKGAFVGKVFD